jgi:hypothetical protein
VRTGNDSSAWLSLDDSKAIELAELTALRVDRGRRGFNLTLAYGEIKTQINEPLASNEDFTIQAGNLALAVRGTVFTTNYRDGILKVAVESGEVAVLDEHGNELERLGPSESGEYEAGEAPDSGAVSSAESQGVQISPSPSNSDGEFLSMSAVIIYLDEYWTGSFSLTKEDISDVVIYVDGMPHPVSIDTFELFVNEDRWLYRISFDQFADYPATYQVSLKVQGIEFTVEQSDILVVNENKSYERNETYQHSTQPPAPPKFPADGYGVWDNGNYRYEGEWRNGKPHGQGVYTFSWSEHGRTYDERLEAEWVDGLPNGEAKLSEHGVDHERSMEWDYVWSGNMVDGYFHGRMVEEYHSFDDGGFSGTTVFEADMGTITAVISNTNPSYLDGSIGDDYYIGNVAGNFLANGHSFPWNR